MTIQQAPTAYRAIVERAAFHVPRNGGRFRLAGPEAQIYLHRMITNEFLSLTPGQGTYACLLEIDGRMLSDLWAWVVSPEEVLVETPAETCDVVMANLDKYLIMEEVEIQDARGDESLVTIQGPKAVEALSNAVAMDIPSLEPGHLWQTSDDGTGIIVAVHDRTGQGGLDVYTPGGSEALVDALRETGMPEAPAEALEVLRIEAGIPLWGAELTTETIPLEANLVGKAISFKKGCYPGQEIIARIHSRGTPARHLCGIAFEAAGPAAGASVISEGRSAGVVTSATDSPRYGCLALAYMHKDTGDIGSAVTCNGVAGRIVELPMESTR